MSGVKKQITVIACANAAGNVIPPLVLFSRKALNPQLTIGEVPGTMYCRGKAAQETMSQYNNS